MNAPQPPSRAELAALDLFASADLDSLEPMLRSCPVRALQPGEVLIRAGDSPGCLYLLIAGELSVHLESPHVQALLSLSQGKTVGEISLIDQKPATAYVVAAAESRVLVVDEALLWILADSSHAVAYNLLHTLATRLRDGNYLIREEREQLRKYKFHASVDSLTGLFNRHWLLRMMTRQMERARANGEALALLLLDVDYFKQFNDSHGHVAGDHALRSVAGCLRGVVRPTDMVARYGGEEFAVLLPGAELDQACQIADRIREAISRTPISYADHPDLPPVTASFGAAAMTDRGTVQAFLEAADQALYRAKQAGRNRVSR
jgi:diguanylate cyclase (GGDEF)-like protein